MFAIKKSKVLDIDLARIVGEPDVLLFDEVPVLFTGRNKYGSRIVGSSVTSDFETDTERYFHILLSETDFREYQNGAVTYRDLLKAARPIYVFDKVESDVTSFGYTYFRDVPQNLLPTEQTFFPSTAIAPSILYSTKLKGGNAENHLAAPKHVGVIQNQISSVLTTSLHALQQRLGFAIESLMSPATASSYGMNFVLTLTGAPLTAQPQQLLGFVKEFTEFIAKDLSIEIDDLLSKPDAMATDSQFEKLFEKALNLAPIAAKNDEDFLKRKSEFRHDLQKDVLSIPPLLVPVAEIVQKSYTSLEIDNNSAPLATVDADFIQTLDGVMVKLNEETVDETIKTFRIMVYSFNKHSGIGKADLLIEDVAYKISVHLSKPLTEEKTLPYTKSMHENNFFNVVGQMTYRGQRPHQLDI